MHGGLRGRVIAAGLVVPLVAALAACSDATEKKAKARATASCPADIGKTAADPLPSDIPAPNGATAYLSASQGATKVWFFALDRGSAELASMRDAYDNTLKGKGYTIKGTDQEDGAEAESEFSGPHDGTTNFQPLCTGKVKLRLKLES